jgi:hypothetical protein
MSSETAASPIDVDTRLSGRKHQARLAQAPMSLAQAISQRDRDLGLYESQCSQQHIVADGLPFGGKMV